MHSRWTLAGWIVSLCLAAQMTMAQPAAAETDNPATAELLDFYAELYGKPENFETRIGGLVSVVSLSRYDGGPLTERLLVAAGSGDPIIAQAAWEALAARHDSLTGEQRRAWQDAGLKLATGRSKREVFLGVELRSLLLALAGRPVERDVARFNDLIGRAIEQNDLATEAGRATLTAAGQALAAWADKGMINRLIRDVRGDNAKARRTLHVLSQLPDTPAADASLGDWRKWAGGLNLTPTPRPYDGGSLWFEPPIVIDDPNDPRFRRELELGSLEIDGLDMVLAIDATGSLDQSNAYLIHYLTVTLQTLSILSDDIRVGVAYYRHEIRPELQTDRCREAMANNHPNAFLYDVVPLTGNYNALLQAMRKDRLSGVPTGHPGGQADGSAGAPAAGFEVAVRLLAEQSREGRARVVVLQADDDPTVGSLPILEAMVTESRTLGILPVMLIRDNTDADRMRQVIDASGAPEIPYRDDLDAYQATDDPYADFATKPLGQVATRVITSTLPEDYADRGPVVMEIIAQHLAAASAAQRAAAQ